MTGPLGTVKLALQAYVDKDRAALEGVIAEDYRFTSPVDNALDRATYFARCWPGSEVMDTVDVLHGTEDGELAWIAYESAMAGKRFRNAELHRVRDGRIVETQVFFGWTLPHAAPAGGFIENERQDPA
ncbi:MAG TPA: nuclear transport factor 2 family protein [Longimicrobium sp.]|nr:nuclear transport factor 2 family protein [Longimicrobium sp.]